LFTEIACCVPLTSPPNEPSTLHATFACSAGTSATSGDIATPSAITCRCKLVSCVSDAGSAVIPVDPSTTPNNPPVTVSVCGPEVHNWFPLESRIEKVKDRAPVTGVLDSTNRPTYANTGVGAVAATCAEAFPANPRIKISARTRKLLRMALSPYPYPYPSIHTKASSPATRC
jgi:hypothetical protein